MKPSELTARASLTCDGPQGCGYATDVQMPDTWEGMEALVETACPKCGGDMLTEASARAGWRAIQGHCLLLELGGALGVLRQVERGEDPGPDAVSVSIKTTPQGATETRIRTNGAAE